MASESTQTEHMEVYVGAVIEINDKPINLIPSTPINLIDDHGLKLSLDKPLELGKFGDAMNSICTDIGVQNPLSEEKLAKINSPLFTNVANKVASATMRIEALKYEQPPKKLGSDGKPLALEKQDSTKYVFVASVNWTDDNSVPQTGNQTKKDFFKLKALIVGISSGFTKSETGENTEVRNAFQSALQAMQKEGPSDADHKKMISGKDK